MTRYKPSALCIFARFYGEMHEYYGTYTWQKLNEVAIPHLGIEVPGKPHDAAHDAAATALLIKKLAELADQELPPGWHPPVYVPCAGCGHVVQECAEPDDIWHCQSCSLEKGLYHRCPGCTRVVEVPVTGYSCDDLCQSCHQRLHQEMMLLTGSWHWCPDHWYAFVVETPDLEEPCEHCQRQREWKRRAQEAERERQARLERERKERRRVYAKEYRQRCREREEEKRRWAALGMLPLEIQKAKPVEVLFSHNGHQFQCRKDEDGRSELHCLKCDAAWSKLPRCSCAGIKTYRAWTAIPEYLMTRTQLLKLKLKPAKGQKAAAVMEGYFGRYRLYNRHFCVPVEQKQRARTKTTRT